MMMEATHSSETLILTRTTRRHIPGDSILHSHCGEILVRQDTVCLWTCFSE
jgi:hypothetical protein